MTLSVGIIGAGRMAQSFDAPGDGPVLSLAHAVQNYPGTSLDGFFDSQPERAAAAEQRWDCLETPRDRQAWFDRGWDIFVIATPDAQHAEDLADALERRPRAILVEKPVADNVEQAMMLLERARQLSIPVLVDFPRRYHSATAGITEDIAAGTLGKPIAATCVYSGSASHAAVHMLDLLFTWWGDWAITVTAQSSAHTILELHHGDQCFRATFISLPPSPYIWEMRVYCENGRVQLAESPEYLDFSTPRPHPDYPAFNVLQSERRVAMETEPLLERLFKHVADAATDPATAKRCLNREIAGQRFTGAMLSALGEANGGSL